MTLAALDCLDRWGCLDFEAFRTFWAFFMAFGRLTAGFGTAYLAGLPRLEGSWTEKLWRVASWICILLTAVSFLKMYLWFAHVAQ